MQHIEADTIIDRPVAQVFQFVARDHFQNHPKWDPTIIEIMPLSPGPIAVGSTAQVIRKQGPGTLEVTAFEPDRLLTTRSIIGPFILVMTCHLTAVDAAHTRLQLHAATAARGLIRLIAPLLKPVFTRTMRQSLARIKAMVEQEDEPFRNGATA